MDKTAVLEALKELADPNALEGMSRFGIETTDALGVSMPRLRELGRWIGKDRALAEELWTTGSREARILATLIAPAGSMDEPSVLRWLQEVRDWEACDQLCMNLVRHNDRCLEWAERWAEDDSLFVRRAAFATIAAAAVSMKGVQHDERFIELMDLVDRHADDSRPLVQKSLAWAMRSVARRDGCRKAVLQLCQDMEGSPSRRRSALGLRMGKELAVRYG